MSTADNEHHHHFDEASFSDLMVEQIRSTPWLLISVVVHVLLALVLNLMAVAPTVRTEVISMQASTDPIMAEPEEIPDEPEDEIEKIEPVEREFEDLVIRDVQVEDPNETKTPQDDPEPTGDENESIENPFNDDYEPGVIGLGVGGGGPFGDRPGEGGPGGPPSGPIAAYKVVHDGLAWLKYHQSPDGRWDCDGFMVNGSPSKGALCDGKGLATYDVGVSGLALLAFLGAGNTHRNGAFKQTVRKGLRWMKGQQDAEGCFGSRGDSHFTYNHAIASLAMAEAYGMTKARLWRNTAQNGINFAVKCQNPYKAWRYGERPGENDCSVTGWFVMALKSAQLSKLDVGENHMKWAHDFVKEMTDEETGRTGYMKKGELPVRAEGRQEQFPATESESLTAVGMLVRTFNNEDPTKSAALKAGAELLSKRLPVWEPKTGRVDMYYWYYGTLAMFQMGGPQWQAWNGKMKAAIINSQRTDGNYRGSWDNCGPWGDDGGRVYSTAVMTMCLEVYYRYGRVFGTR